MALLLAGCGVPPGPVRHTSTARIGGRFERTVRRADVLGLTPASLHSTRPSSIGDLLRSFPDETDSPADVGEVADEVEHSPDMLWFAPWAAGYEEEVADQWDESETGRFRFSPVADSRLRIIAVDKTVRFENEQGREFQNGLNFYLSHRSTARLYDRVVVTAEPELSAIEREGVPDEDAGVNLRFQELTASVRIGPAEVTVGRQPLWWGPGRHGSLLLSNNARPFDLIKLSTAGPIILPWYFAHLGLIRGELFVTQLETARGVERPILAGMRLESRVLPWLEIGASRTAQFGGKGRSVTGRTIWEVFTASTENDEDDPGNQLASIDARVIVPWSVQPFEVYGELGGEDEAGGFFSREAYLLGVYLPRIGPWHMFELGFEYADTTVFGHLRTWYTNANFPDGYTFHERIIGHHVGSDGQDFFAELRVHAPVVENLRLSLILAYGYEEHLRLDPVEERLHQIRATVELTAIDTLTFAAFYEHQIWENFAQQRGDHEVGDAVGFGVTWEF